MYYSDNSNARRTIFVVTGLNVAAAVSRVHGNALGPFIARPPLADRLTLAEGFNYKHNGHYMANRNFIRFTTASAERLSMLCQVHGRSIVVMSQWQWQWLSDERSTTTFLLTSSRHHPPRNYKHITLTAPSHCNSPGTFLFSTKYGSCFRACFKIFQRDPF